MNGGLTRIFLITTGTALSVLLGFTSSPAWADGWHSHRSGGSGHGMERHGEHHGGKHHRMLHLLLRRQKDIGLTEEQVGKLKALALDQDRAKIRAHADVMVAERELRALVWDEKADLSAIKAKLKERASLEANVRFMDIKGKRELLAVLTPEQRDKFKAMRVQMRESRRAGMLSHDLEPAAREETEPYEGTGGPQVG